MATEKVLQIELGRGDGEISIFENTFSGSRPILLVVHEFDDAKRVSQYLTAKQAMEVSDKLRELAIKYQVK